MSVLSVRTFTVGTRTRCCSWQLAVVTITVLAKSCPTPTSASVMYALTVTTLREKKKSYANQRNAPFDSVATHWVRIWKYPTWWCSVYGRPDRLWGPPSLLSNGNSGSLPGIKRPGSDVDHSPPSNTQVNIVYTFTPLYMRLWSEQEQLFLYL
jgi:hypothetical protein